MWQTITYRVILKGLLILKCGLWAENQWSNGTWTWGEKIAVREIDSSVMKEGNGSVRWSKPVTSRLIVGTFFCERLKAAQCCGFDWHGRLTQKGWFAFSLGWRLASLPGCFSTVKHTATLTVIETVKHYRAVSAQGSTLYISEAHDWQSVYDKETVKELHWKWT